MKKIAFFVEGQTERIFLEYFIEQYLSTTDKMLDSYKIKGESLITISKGIEYPDPSYYFLIYDVGNDEKVASAITEFAASMIEDKNFDAIVGLRDLHPKPKTDYTIIKEAFIELFETVSYSDKVHLVISIMQIEAWLLGDFNLFRLIDNELSVSTINSRLNIDLINDNIEDYNNPSTIIDRIFRIINKSYSKHESEVHTICSRIDFCYLCFDENYYRRVRKFNDFLRLFNILTD